MEEKHSSLLLFLVIVLLADNVVGQLGVHGHMQFRALIVLPKTAHLKCIS